MRTVVIYNPSAGRGRGDAIAAALRRGLTTRGLEVDLEATTRPKEAMTIARRCAPSVDIVVAVGGDGTINEVANGMAAAFDDHPPATEAGSEARDGEAVDGAADSVQDRARRRARLGIMPAGTVNVLALELGLPFQVERACNVIAGGKTVAFDLGRVNGRHFVLMMGAGIDALTIRNIDLRQKRRFKELAFVTTGLKSGFAAKPPEFLVRANGEEHRATFFVAGNSRYYGGRFGLTPHADPTDGTLDLLLYTGTSRAGLAVFWLGVPSGLHLRDRNVVYLHSEQAELLPLDDSQVVWYQTDGELAGRLPAVIDIDSRALEILVP